MFFNVTILLNTDDENHKDKQVLNWSPLVLYLKAAFTYVS